MQRPDTAPAMAAKLPWVPGEFAKTGAVIYGAAGFTAAINKKGGRRHSSFKLGCPASISGGGPGSKSLEMRRPEPISALT